MAREKINLRAELNTYKYDFDLLQKIPCSAQENKEYQNILKNGGSLPSGVYQYEYTNGAPTNEFYTIYETDLTEAEIQEYLTYKQLSLIRTIKNGVSFFVVLTILGLFVWFLILTGVFNFFA